MNPLIDIRSAVITGFQTGNLFPAKDICWQNIKFDPSGKDFWCEFHYMPGTPAPITLGLPGEDEMRGMFQITLNEKLGDGEERTLKKLQELRNYFYAGKDFSYAGQVVTVTKSGPGPSFNADGYYRTPYTVYFYSRLNRTP
jgi:hypothetical protein